MLVFYSSNAQTICPLEEFLPKLEMDETDDLMLTTFEIRKIEALCTRFEHLNSVTKALQSDNVNLAEASAFFDTVIEEYPDTTDRWSKSAAIVHQPDV